MAGKKSQAVERKGTAIEVHNEGLIAEEGGIGGSSAKLTHGTGFRTEQASGALQAIDQSKENIILSELSSKKNLE